MSYVSRLSRAWKNGKSDAEIDIDRQRRDLEYKPLGKQLNQISGRTTDPYFKLQNSVIYFIIDLIRDKPIYSTTSK